MKLILMIDTSGSMKGHKIGAVDDAMDNLLDDLRNFSSANEAVTISMLIFSKTVSWIQRDDIDIADFEWSRPECNGMTSLGAACLALYDKLEAEFTEGYTILLLSDGCPTDDYDEGIESLDSLRSFNNARRFAIALGTDADIPSLVRFTADPDNVFKVSDLNTLLSTMMRAIDIETPLPPIQPPISKNIETEDDWD